MSWLGDFVSNIVDFIKGLWDKLGFLLVIALIIFVACAPYLVGVLGTGTAFAASLPAWLSWLPAVVSGFAAYGPLTCAIAGMGLAYLVNPTDTANVIHGVADVVGDTVGTVVGSGVGALTSSSGLGSLLLWGGIGFLAYLVLTSDKSDKPESDYLVLTSDKPGKPESDKSGSPPRSSPSGTDGGLADLGG